MSPESLEAAIVGELMQNCPQAVRVFLRHRMKCPGCPMAPFMTVAEAAAEHGIAAENLTRDLMDAIREREAS